MVILVAGTRSFSNYQLLEERLNYYLSKSKKVKILCGEERGIEELAQRYAHSHCLPLKIVPANYKDNGDFAILIRNVNMAKEADAAVVFWDGVSQETQHVIKTAENMGIPVRVVKI